MGSQDSVIEEILSQTRKTNGRVSALEMRVAVNEAREDERRRITLQMTEDAKEELSAEQERRDRVTTTRQWFISLAVGGIVSLATAAVTVLATTHGG